ncbi:MAG: transposase [Reyranella sp.]|uniref:REP-associated tyrosine transposase n=1 Tax=Reyranella sp. TaxID=1929291 RepID=UPI0011FB2380|nr:transposase [Reyranella sp.]TAJ38351.1 MAG: transposase [Reyranella sp.]
MEYKGWHSRGYLPHFDSEDIVQFLTFRLADSLPAEATVKLRQATHPESLRDDMLDRGWGACWLRSDPIASLVEQAFLAFDGARYRLHAWIIMPNHVHVLLTVFPGFALGGVVGSWKRYTAREANKILGRAGAFWQDDYWDRFIRNEDHFAATVAYIDQNSVKAGLVSAAGLWPWGSARFRA